MSEVTELLEAWGAGRADAFDRLLPLVYRELRAQAAGLLEGERRGHTLQPTALVHEAFLRLVGHDRTRWHGRTHFLAVAACAMRRVLVDHARARAASKRGGGVAAVTLHQDGDAVEPGPAELDLVALDDVLGRLAAFDARAARVIELRYFGGLTFPEIAAATGTSVATAKRDWTAARAWLRRALGSAA